MANVVEISVKANDQTKSGFGSSTTNANKLGNAAEGVKGKLGLLKVGAAAVVGSGLVKFFADSTAEARESQKVNADTANVLKTTGGAANVTAKQVGDLATAISNKTGIDDEAIQSGQNMLLTFTNVRNEAGKGNDIFNQATGIMTDLAAKMGTSTPKAAIQLGKALNDPVKGIGALSRVGVTFTAGQKEQIKTLVASGNTMGAQKIILKELGKEFGGTAAAQATAGEKMSTTWKNVEEQVGTALLPVINKLENFISTKLLPAFVKLIVYLQAHWPAIKKVLLAAISPIIAIIKFLFEFIKSHIATFEALGKILIKIAPYLLAVGAAVVIMTNPWLLAIAAVLGIIAAWDKIKAATKVFVDFFTKTIPAAVGKVIDYIKQHWKIAALIAGPIGGAIILVLTHWNSIKKIFTDAIGAILGFLKQLPGKAVTAIGDVHVRLYQKGRQLIGGLWAGAVAFFWMNIDFFGHLAGTIINAIGDVHVRLYQLGRQLLGGLWSGAKSFFFTNIDFFAHLIGHVISALGIVNDRLMAKGRALIGGLWNGAKSAWVAVRTWFAHLIGNSAIALGVVGGRLVDKGRALIGGLWNGIKAKWNDVINWFKHLPGKIIKAMGFGSPPGWAIKAGGWIIEGMLKGVGHKVPSLAKYLANRAKELGKTLIALPIAGSQGFTGSRKDNKLMSQQLLKFFGWGTGPEQRAFDALEMSEAGYNQNAQNPTSTAYGMGQFLDSTWAPYGPKTSDPRKQLLYMMEYIRDRYGDPIAAWSYHQGHNSYGKGSWDIPSTQMATIHKGEMIIPAAPAARIRSGTGGGATVITLEINSAGAKIDDLMVELIRKAVRVRGGNVQFALGR